MTGSSTQHSRHGSPVWDAVVIGAGPAGALAARQIALRGASVLLVDRKPVLRRKVCGTCFNRRALSALAHAGLGDLTRGLGAVPVENFVLMTDGTRATLSFAAGVSLSRERFDAALTEAAQSSGVEFLPETTATVGECQEDTRTLWLRQEGTRREVQARAVVVASGLGGGASVGSPAHSGDELLDCPAVPGARIGAGCILPDAPAAYPSGTVWMAIGSEGYVGLVRTEQGALNIAAAFDTEELRKAGGPGPVAAAIVRRAGLPEISDLQVADWKGTPALTRHAEQVAGERVFLVGDAAGYVEPFTGEGIAWALESALAVTPVVVRAISRWTPVLSQDWSRIYRRRIVRRQWMCRMLAAGLRRPWVVRSVLQVLAGMPWIAAPLAWHANSGDVRERVSYG